MKRFIIGIMIFMIMGSTQGCYPTQSAIASDVVYESKTSQAFDTATITLKFIRDRNYESLSELVHPQKGIIFVPYGYVDYNEHLTFSAEQIKDFSNTTTVYTWGVVNQSADMIDLTIEDYFNRYVYNKDFITTEQIAINYIIGISNAIENVKDIFPDSYFVEFYDKGTEEYAGLDWASLKIVMEEYDGEFKIVAIIHSDYVM